MAGSGRAGSDRDRGGPDHTLESGAVTTSLPAPVPERMPLALYPLQRAISTRWMDNDVYGHVNNVVYYSYFDTVVNASLIEAGVLDIHHGEVIGLVVSSQCNYFAPLSFPEPVIAGLRVARLGSSSVTYQIGLFAQGVPGHTPQPAAQGQFIHVYVDRASRRPTALPAPLREFLQTLVA
jgi:acyl-CoA thioester hydrolase